MISRRLALAGGTALLATMAAGCATTLAPITYDLAPGNFEPVRRRSSRTVVIILPKAVSTYDTERLVVRQPGGVLSYLPEAQWSDRLPRLLQTRLLHTFEDAGFANVGRPDDQLAVDVTLATEIRAFEIDVSGAPTAVVSLSAKLVDERQGSVSPTKTFEARLPASAETGAAAVAGLDAALRDVARQILLWTAQEA